LLKTNRKPIASLTVHTTSGVKKVPDPGSATLVYLKGGLKFHLLKGTMAISIRSEKEQTDKLLSFKTWDTHLKTLISLETRSAISSEESRETLDELSSLSSASTSSDS
jgi:hypothetical protein